MLLLQSHAGKLAPGSQAPGGTFATGCVLQQHLQAIPAVGNAAQNNLAMLGV